MQLLCFLSPSLAAWMTAQHGHFTQLLMSLIFFTAPLIFGDFSCVSVPRGRVQTVGWADAGVLGGGCSISARATGGSMCSSMSLWGQGQPCSTSWRVTARGGSSTPVCQGISFRILQRCPRLVLFVMCMTAVVEVQKAERFPGLDESSACSVQLCSTENKYGKLCPCTSSVLVSPRDPCKKQSTRKNFM